MSISTPSSCARYHVGSSNNLLSFSIFKSTLTRLTSQIQPSSDIDRGIAAGGLATQFLTFEAFLNFCHRPFATAYNQRVCVKCACVERR